jgi:hypothetical protein
VKQLLVPAAAAVAFGVGAVAAYAHTVGVDVTTYEGPRQCIKQSAWTQHSSAPLDSAADVRSTDNQPEVFPCGPEKYKPAGHLGVRREAFKWTGSSWALFNNSGWIYNGSSAFQIYHQRQWSSLPQGAGYYGTMGHGNVYDNGWKGGSVWSGDHYLP